MNTDDAKKTCWACHKRKSVTRFSKNRHTRDGLVDACKPCEIARLRAYRQRCKEWQ